MLLLGLGFYLLVHALVGGVLHDALPKNVQQLDASSSDRADPPAAAPPATVHDVAPAPSRTAQQAPAALTARWDTAFWKDAAQRDTASPAPLDIRQNRARRAEARAARRAEAIATIRLAQSPQPESAGITDANLSAASIEAATADAQTQQQAQPETMAAPESLGASATASTIASAQAVEPTASAQDPHAAVPQRGWFNIVIDLWPFWFAAFATFLLAYLLKRFANGKTEPTNDPWERLEERLRLNHTTHAATAA